MLKFGIRGHDPTLPHYACAGVRSYLVMRVNVIREQVTITCGREITRAGDCCTMQVTIDPTSVPISEHPAVEALRFDSRRQRWRHYARQNTAMREMREMPTDRRLRVLLGARAQSPCARARTCL